MKTPHPTDLRVTGEHIKQLALKEEVYLFRTNDDDFDSVAVRDSRGNIAWDNSGSRFCREPDIFIVREVLYFISQSWSNAERFYVLPIVRHAL